MKVYIELRDWWIGYYRGDTHHYVCPAAVHRHPVEATPAPMGATDRPHPVRRRCCVSYPRGRTTMSDWLAELIDDARERATEMMSGLRETQEWRDGALILALASELRALAAVNHREAWHRERAHVAASPTPEGEQR